MTTLVFLGDIHDDGKSISRSLGSAGVTPEKGKYALLVELGDDGVELIPPDEYEMTLEILCKDKPESPDMELLENLMLGSGNNVYSFDVKGAPESLKRHEGQRNNIDEALTMPDVKNADYVVVVVGSGHLDANAEVPGWSRHQDVPPYYKNVANIVVGLP